MPRLSVELKVKPSDSIANQLAIMRDYAKNRAEFTDTFEYIDNGVSGTSFDRPAFQQMMEDARAGKIKLYHSKGFVQIWKNLY